MNNVITRFGETWNQHDMRALAALFAEDAGFVDVAGQWFKGRAAIQPVTVRHATVFKASR